MADIRNKVQLITYPDSLGGNLCRLYEILKGHFEGVVGGVHILPFYPSSSDRGFSPLTHLEVGPGFGTWEDIDRIGRDFDLVADLMVNHISRESEYFKDYLEKNEASEYKNFFIDEEVFFGERKKNEEDLNALYRPRPETPFREFLFEDGTKKNIFCTFSPDQIDLNVDDPGVRQLLRDFVERLAFSGVDLIRLDAVGYIVKRAGTASFMIPETYKLIRWLSDEAHTHGVSVLPEVHHRFSVQKKLASSDGVDFVYDFGLPMLVLYTIFFGDTGALKRWIDIRPENSITTLDTHDGIGVVDAQGLLSPEEIEKTLKVLRIHGGNAMMRATGKNSENVDIYQMNVTYFSALGESDEGYIIARAIQFFVPGIPQVYYVGALAGKNDIDTLNATGVGRDINRHNYTLEEVEENCQRDVVQKLFHLMRFRNSYPAFEGVFTLVPTKDDVLILRWELDRWRCELFVDFHMYEAHIVYRDVENGKEETIELCRGVDGRNFYALVSDEVFGREVDDKTV
jgi:sucrose phosphorylase